MKEDLWEFTVFLLNFVINQKPYNCSQKSIFKNLKKNPYVRSVVTIWDSDNVILVDVQQPMPERRVMLRARNSRDKV